MYCDAVNLCGFSYPYRINEINIFLFCSLVTSFEDIHDYYYTVLCKAFLSHSIGLFRIGITLFLIPSCFLLLTGCRSISPARLLATSPSLSLFSLRFLLSLGRPIILSVSTPKRTMCTF